MTTLFITLASALLLLCTLTDATVYRHQSNRGKCHGSAVYKVKVVNIATRKRFPAIKDNSIIFSPPVVWSQRDGFTAFKIGMKATRGVQNVAETGNFDMLVKELTQGGGKGFVKQVKTGNATIGTKKSATFNIHVDCVHHYIGFDSMVAPSPDWFIGNARMNVLDRHGSFIKVGGRAFQVYDAGTDSGAELTSPDQPTVPAMDIHKLRGSPFYENVVAFLYVRRIR